MNTPQQIQGLPPSKHGEIKQAFMKLTPALAAAWLAENNLENRTKTSSPIRKYNNDMANQRFPTTHQGIAFDSDHRLLDGQHRLAALAALPEGTEITLLVTWNLPPRQLAFGKLKIDTQDDIDNTNGRPLSNSLVEEGWTRARAFSSALNALAQWGSQSTNPGLSINMANEIIDIFLPEFKELDQTTMPLVCDRAGINAALIILLRLYPSDTRQFIKALQNAPNRPGQCPENGYTAPELLVNRYSDKTKVGRTWSWSAIQMRNTLQSFEMFRTEPAKRWYYLRDNPEYTASFLAQLPAEVESIKKVIGTETALKTQAEFELLAQGVTGKPCIDQQTGIRIKWEVITPEQAQAWLNTLPKNKQLKRSNTKAIRRMAEIMKNRGWATTHQGLALDQYGILLDGRERLTACVRAATPFFTMVADGVRREHEKYIDTGRRRSFVDQICKKGNTVKDAQAYRNIASLIGGNRIWRKVENDEGRAIQKHYEKLLKVVTDLATHKDTPLVLSAPQLRATFSILIGAFEQPAIDLVRRFYFGEAHVRSTEGSLREHWRRLFENHNGKTWYETQGCQACRSLLRDMVQLLTDYSDKTRKMDISTALNHLETRDNRITRVKEILRRADPLAITKPAEH